MKFEKQWNAVKGFFAKIGKRNALIALAVVLIAGAVYLNTQLLLDNAGDGFDYKDPSDTAASGSNQPSPDYFATSIVSRERTRDEAMEVLQSIIDDAGSDEATKTQARKDMATIASAMENEAKVETLVISKGFEQCVAVISGDKINIIVKSDGLIASDIAAINEIVYSQTGILPANTVIIEKSA